MKVITLTALLLCSFAAATARADEIVVVVNPAASAITREEISAVYLARSNAWTPIDQPADSPIYSEFYKKATGRDAAQIKAIWSRVLFTGRGVPPKQAMNASAVKKAIAADPHAVGYIPKSAVDSSVKIALPLD